MARYEPTLVDVMVKESGDLESLVSTLEVHMRLYAADRAVRRAGNVVKKRARQLCPQSIKTGTRVGWSYRTRASRKGTKPLRDTIANITRRYEGNAVAVVGPKYPAGALAHLVEFDRKKVLWGQNTGEVAEGRGFMRRAAEETVAEQKRVMVDTVKKEIAKQGG